MLLVVHREMLDTSLCSQTLSWRVLNPNCSTILAEDDLGSSKEFMFVFLWSGSRGKVGISQLFWVWFCQRQDERAHLGRSWNSDIFQVWRGWWAASKADRVVPVWVTFRHWFSSLRVKACQGWSFPPPSHAAGSVLRSLTKFHLCWLPPPPPHLANPLAALPTESQSGWFPSAFGALFLEVSVTGKQHWIAISNSSVSHHMTGLIHFVLFPVCPPNPTGRILRSHNCCTWTQGTGTMTFCFSGWTCPR